MTDVRMYRKRVAWIEAMQLTKDNAAEVAKWCNGLLSQVGEDGYVLHVYGKNDTSLAMTGDYVIHDADGSFHAVFREAFKALFESHSPVRDDDE